MSTSTLLNAPSRPGKRTKATAVSTGSPDPRPLTDYTVVYENDAGNSKLVVTLAQPCVVRDPKWGVIDVDDGTVIPTGAVTIEDNTTFTFLFEGLLPDTACLLQCPYQDTQVQNFQGGFVRPGATWFRAPK